MMNNRIYTADKPFVMVIFGASGDLTKRKLMPALYSLFKDNRLPKEFSILGVGRTVYSDSQYRSYISIIVKSHNILSPVITVTHTHAVCRAKCLLCS